MKFAATIVRATIDWALPPRCPGCGAVTPEPHRFCASCWASLRFIAPPWCAGCRRPFAFDRGEDALCAACLAQRPAHGGILAAVGYGPVARTVALRLKYGGRIAFAETVAASMVRLIPADAELLVPVPLHRSRLWVRGFNQAALIAAAVARRSGVRHAPAALIRTRRTQILRDLGAGQRKRAVAGAFAVEHGQRERIAGKAIILVDDVHTSGATTNACTAALLRGGAASVTILCWARVLDGDD